MKKVLFIFILLISIKGLSGAKSPVSLDVKDLETTISLVELKINKINNMLNHLAKPAQQADKLDQKKLDALSKYIRQQILNTKS